MTPSSSPQKSGSLVPLRPLASTAAHGEPYMRSAAVEAEIQMMLRRDESEWIGARREIKTETLVFLIRHVRPTDEELAGCLLEELSERTIRIANRWAQGVYEAAREHIALQVEMQILELVLAETGSPQSDFLEVAFGQAVARRTSDAVKKHKNSPMGRQAQIVTYPVDEDGEEIERPIELAEDDRPGPEQIFSRREFVRKARAAVKDSRHLEAVLLRYLEGWPIVAEDKSKPDLVRHFNKSARQIQNWIATALQQMRDAVS